MLSPPFWPLAFALLPLLDAQNALRILRRPLVPTEVISNDFTFLIPLYGHPRYFRNEEFLTPYKHQTLLLVNVDDEPMRGFADEKELDGWRVVRVNAARRRSPGHMLIQGLDAVETTYAIRMDGDSSCADHPGRAVAAAMAAGADLCSVRVVPSRRDTLIEKLQGVEYDVSMLGRHIRPWLTSGACMIAKTSSYRRIMRHHSLYYYGEDVETGMIAKYLRMWVGHVDFTVYTDVPETFGAWLQQRRGWWAGSFRTWFVNLDKHLRYPTLILYNLGLVWLLLEGKILSTVQDLALIPILLGIYIPLTALANWRVRSRLMLVFPLYSLFQALVLPPLGFLRYVQLVYASRWFGRYKIGSIRDKRRPLRAYGATFNARSVGPELRYRREVLNLALPDAAAELHVPVEYLKALEDEEFARLPSLAAVFGLPRMYARYLGLGDVGGEAGRRAQLTSAVTSYVPRIALTLAGAAAGAAAMLAVGHVHLTSVRNSAAGTLPPAAPRPAAAAALPARVSLAAADGDCWISVRAGSSTGRVLFEAVLRRGERRTFSGHRLWVRLGAAGHVRGTLNGRPIAIPRGTVNLTLSASGMTARAT